MAKDTTVADLVLENSELRRHLRDRNYLLFAAKLAFMPENSDFTDDEFSTVILQRLCGNSQ